MRDDPGIGEVFADGFKAGALGAVLFVGAGLGITLVGLGCWALVLGLQWALS